MDFFMIANTRRAYLNYFVKIRFEALRHCCYCNVATFLSVFYLLLFPFIERYYIDTVDVCMVIFVGSTGFP